MGQPVYLIQLKLKRKRRGMDVWVDTVWGTLLSAQVAYPKKIYREVMVRR